LFQRYHHILLQASMVAPPRRRRPTESKISETHIREVPERLDFGAEQ
jgi:hypothetical protein